MSTREGMALAVGNATIRDFKSWSVDADMYQAASAWQVELSAKETDVRAGQECTLAIGRTVILHGIVDRLSIEYSRSGSSLTLAGRDLMGLVVDSYCESFVSLQGMSIKGIAEQLLRTVPFVSRKSIVYRNKADRLAAKRAIQVEPGSTVFDILREAAESRGLLFYCMPDGTLVFSKPTGTVGADSRPRFSLVNENGRNRSRIKKATFVDDLAPRYSKVKIVGQQQGYDDLDAPALNIQAVRTDSLMPFYKPYVETINDDSESPTLVARRRLEEQRWRGQELSYTVAGHDQGGNVWAVDEICSVRDERLGIIGKYLVSGRTLRYSRDEGSETEVRLCMPGVIA